MLRATAIARPGQEPFLDTVTLDYDQRHRRRIRLTGEQGHEILLDLTEVPDLQGGDGIVFRMFIGRAVIGRYANHRS